MEIFDVSLKIRTGMLSYPGDPRVETGKVSAIDEDGVELSQISMGMHAGTHVDAPSHFLQGGRSIDQVSPEALCGQARVFNLSHVRSKIFVSDLRGLKIKKREIVLFKTRNSKTLGEPFHEDFIHLSEDAADYLVQRKVKAVGIDYLSVDSFSSKDHYVHKKLLTNNVSIIEGLDLRKIREGAYTCFCLPLNVEGAEAAPARCLLVRY